MAVLRKGSRRLARALDSSGRELNGRLKRLAAARPIDVHQTRVAIRRLRSLLKVFRPYFESPGAAAHRRELGRVADLLGELRAFDVLAQFEPFGAAPIQQRLQRERDAALRRLQRRSRSARNATALKSAAAPPASWDLGLRRDLTDQDLLQRLQRAWSRVEEAVATSANSERSRHELRILLKRQRYSLEIVHDFHSQQFKALDRALRATQQVLGDWRDVRAAQTWLTAARAELDRAVVAQASRDLRGRESELRAALGTALSDLVDAGRRWSRVVSRDLK